MMTSTDTMYVMNVNKIMPSTSTSLTKVKLNVYSLVLNIVREPTELKLTPV